jgi:hypothetical protein
MFGSSSRHFHLFFCALPIRFVFRTTQNESIARAESGLQRALFLAMLNDQMVSTGRFHHGNVILLRALVEAPDLAANNLRAPDTPSNSREAIRLVAGKGLRSRSPRSNGGAASGQLPTAARRTASRLSWPTRFPRRPQPKGRPNAARFLHLPLCQVMPARTTHPLGPGYQAAAHASNRGIDEREHQRGGQAGQQLTVDTQAGGIG